MPTHDTQPDEATVEAERSEADRSHISDREGTREEEDRAEDNLAHLSPEDRERVADHEREMAARGAHQAGEGKIE